MVWKIELSKILKMLSPNLTNLWLASIGIQLDTELNSIIKNKSYGLTNLAHAHVAYKRQLFPCYHMKNNLNCLSTNVLFTSILLKMFTYTFYYLKNCYFSCVLTNNTMPFLLILLIFDTLIYLVTKKNEMLQRKKKKN